MTYCKDCGGFLKSRRILADYCPVCSTAEWRRLGRRLFWGGTISLAFLAGLYVLISPRGWDEWQTVLGAWALITLFIAIFVLVSVTGIDAFYGDGGNGGG